MSWRGGSLVLRSNAKVQLRDSIIIAAKALPLIALQLQRPGAAMVASPIARRTAPRASERLGGSSWAHSGRRTGAAGLEILHKMKRHRQVARAAEIADHGEMLAVGRDVVSLVRGVTHIVGI